MRPQGLKGGVVIPSLSNRAGSALGGAFLAVALAHIVPDVAVAQAILRGRVVDSEFGHPLAGASVRIKGSAATLTTDSAGRFEATGLPTGTAEVAIQLLGYERGVFQLHVPLAGVVERDFALDFSGHELPEVVVQGRVERMMPRYTDFERRRQRKLGAYFRWDELYQKGFSSVGDALRTVRGVRIRCNQETFECHAVMARSPGCQPTWWIDGVEVRSFHENTPIRDIYGIEIYRGPGEIPGEFAGSNAACGVIVVWTKSRPYRIER